MNICIPQSPYKPKNEIEDLVSKDIWESILRHLDSKGLISLISKQDVIVDYDFEEQNRTKVKSIFADKLIEAAKRNLTKFNLFKTLFETIHLRVEQLNGS